MPTRALVLSLVLTAAGLWSLAGCASSSSPHPDIAPTPLADIDARALPLVDGRTGQALTWQSLIAAASGADAILVGEVHNHAAGQAFEAAFFADILSAAPTAAAALEFYDRDNQAAMDDYLTGVVSPHEFRRLTGRNQGDDCPGHRAMIDACKEHQRPAVAANAPRRYVKVARTDGYDRLAALLPEQRRLYRIPDRLPEGRYRDDFFELMRADNADAAHKDMDESRIQGMFRAQGLWDWTMADSVARTIDNTARPARPVVLIVGKFHTDHDGGLAQALRALRPGSRLYIVSLENETKPPLSDELKGVADAVVYLGEEHEAG